MIQLWRGEPPTEDAFHQGADPDGHSLGLVCTLLRTAVVRGDESDIDLALRQGRRVAVTVNGPRYVDWQRKSYPSATSRHGTLCPPGSWGKPYHAVLLVARRADVYALHDPWFPAAPQPFEMSEDAFLYCFAGQAVMALP